MAHETEDVDLREEWCELGRDATWHNLNSCFSKGRAMFGKSKALPRSTHVISGKTETNLFFFFFFFTAGLRVASRNLFLSQWWAGASGTSSRGRSVKHSGFWQAG